MESTDLISGFAPSGDAQSVANNLKREHDSLDDFEHLQREPEKPAVNLLDATIDDVPSDQVLAPSSIAAVKNFLDTEREEMFITPQKTFPDHIADKFTDSESEASESPLRSAPTSHVTRPVEQPPPPPIHSEPLIELKPQTIEPELKTEPVSELPKKTSEPKLPVQTKAETAKPTPETHFIEAEVIFCQMGLDAWFNPERLHPKVESLIYWRDPVRSGIALGAGLALLIALRICSLVSVVAYTSLLILTGTVAFRIYKNILQAVQKTSDGHPFKWLLDQELSIPAERVQSIAAAGAAHLNAAANELRRLFLVEDLVDSLKFGVVLWCLTYVGACFYGITLIILGYVALFTLPKAYEANKAQVDANLELARAKIREITDKVRAAVPIGKKAESDKDK